MFWPETKTKQTIKPKTDQNYIKKKHKNIKVFWQKHIKHQEYEEQDEYSNRNPVNTNHKPEKFSWNQEQCFVCNHA
jgi:hypothetical protein